MSEKTLYEQEMGTTENSFQEKIEKIKKKNPVEELSDNDLWYYKAYSKYFKMLKYSIRWGVVQGLLIFSLIMLPIWFIVALIGLVL